MNLSQSGHRPHYRNGKRIDFPANHIPHDPAAQKGIRAGDGMRKGLQKIFL